MVLMAGAPFGNDNATKLRDSATKQDAYKKYCAHIASGMPKQSFVYDNGIITLTYETLDKYIREDPIEFNPILMKAAKARGFGKWIDKGISLMEGKYKHGSPVIYQTIMRNIFRNDGIAWDRNDPIDINRPVELVDKHAEVMQSLTQAQEDQKAGQAREVTPSPTLSASQSALDHPPDNL